MNLDPGPEARWRYRMAVAAGFLASALRMVVAAGLAWLVLVPFQQPGVDQTQWFLPGPWILDPEALVQTFSRPWGPAQAKTTLGMGLIRFLAVLVLAQVLVARILGWLWEEAAREEVARLGLALRVAAIREELAARLDPDETITSLQAGPGSAGGPGRGTDALLVALGFLAAAVMGLILHLTASWGPFSRNIDLEVPTLIRLHQAAFLGMGIALALAAVLEAAPATLVLMAVPFFACSVVIGGAFVPGLERASELPLRLGEIPLLATWGGRVVLALFGLALVRAWWRGRRREFELRTSQGVRRGILSGAKLRSLGPPEDQGCGPGRRPGWRKVLLAVGGGVCFWIALDALFAGYGPRIRYQSIATELARQGASPGLAPTAPVSILDVAPAYSELFPEAVAPLVFQVLDHRSEGRLEEAAAIALRIEALLARGPAIYTVLGNRFGELARKRGECQGLVAMARSGSEGWEPRGEGRIPWRAALMGAIGLPVSGGFVGVDSRDREELRPLLARAVAADPGSPAPRILGMALVLTDGIYHSVPTAEQARQDLEAFRKAVADALAPGSPAERGPFGPALKVLARVLPRVLAETIVQGYLRTLLDGGDPAPWHAIFDELRGTLFLPVPAWPRGIGMVPLGGKPPPPPTGLALWVTEPPARLEDLARSWPRLLEATRQPPEPLPWDRIREAGLPEVVRILEETIREPGDGRTGDESRLDADLRRRLVDLVPIGSGPPAPVLPAAPER